MKSWRKFLVFFSVFIFGVLADRLVGVHFLHPTSALSISAREKGYTYISPLLYCRYPNNNTSQLMTKLHNDLDGYIEDAIDKGLLQNASVFFNDPATGEWTSINGNDQYDLASLIKVAYLMTLYKEAETNPSLLTTTLQYDGTNDNDIENFKPPEQAEMQNGHKYSADDVISRMIIYSDNSAANLLTSHMSAVLLNNEFLEPLNFSPITNGETEISMTVGKYATLFRILYNATYLTPDMSEKALALLSKTTFTQGIVAGIPQHITVAHKFGERVYAASAIKELHDCGIVYYPNHPYILCIMTKGFDFNTLETTIQTISKTAYDAVNSAYGRRS